MFQEGREGVTVPRGGHAPGGDVRLASWKSFFVYLKKGDRDCKDITDIVQY